MKNKPLLAVACLVIAAIVMFALLRSDPAPPGGPPALPVATVPPGAAATSDDAARSPGDAARVEAPAAVPVAASAPRKEPDAADLWGRVIEVGTAIPIGNAEVELQHRDADEFWNLDIKYGEHIASLARTRTDAEGRFRFDVVGSRRYRLAVHAANYAPVTVPKCTGGAEVIVELSRGASLDGVVRCEGKPVADIDVRIAVYGESIELARGRTDGGGAFRFIGLPAANVFVQVASAEFAEEWKRLEITASGEHHVEVELQRGRKLRGRVIEATTSTPIVGAEVSDSWTFKRLVRTDADGRFSIAGVSDEGFVMCHVRAAGYASAGRNVAGHLGEEAEFRLVRGGDVVGRIVDATGAPVASVFAAVCTSIREGPGMGGADWITAAVGGDGRFQCVGLRPDQHYSLMARRSGYGTRVYALPRMLGSGERIDVGDVVMLAAGGIEGRVVDEAGAGLADQRVYVRGANADSEAWLAGAAKPEEVSQFTLRSAVTDRSGAFRVRGLAAGTYGVWLDRRDGSGGAPADTRVKDGAITGGIEFVVAKGLAISGTIAYTNGKAAGDELGEVYLQAQRGSGGRYGARVGSGGAFRFAGVAEGEYTISVSGAPKGWALTPVTGVRAGTSDVKLLLEPAVVLSGRVVDAAGNAVKARVWARSDRDSGGSPYHATDDEGRFRLEVAPTFVGTIGAVDLPDHARQGELAHVVAGQTDIVITLTKETPTFGRRVR